MPSVTQPCSAFHVKDTAGRASCCLWAGALHLTGISSSPAPRPDWDGTVQGLNRVQQAPSVSRAMHNVLQRCQQRLGTWVGSSVVHLGDHNVPNALMFIDKYTQVCTLPISCLQRPTSAVNYSL